MIGWCGGTHHLQVKPSSTGSLLGHSKVTPSHLASFTSQGLVDTLL